MVEAYWRRADPDYNDGGVESFNDALRRVDVMRERLLHNCLGQTVIVFGHGMFIKMLEWKLQSAAASTMNSFQEFHEVAPMPNCSILKCEVDDKRWWYVQ